MTHRALQEGWSDPERGAERQTEREGLKQRGAEREQEAWPNTTGHDEPGGSQELLHRQVSPGDR